MNKSSVKQKRSLGKNCPLSKRPKLDFTLTTSGSVKEFSDTGKALTNVCKKVIKENSGENSSETERDENFSNTDWDDDFSGDMLERVCLIADLSQAMVTNEAAPDAEKEKSEVLKKRFSPKHRSSFTTVESEVPCEMLKLEFEKLQEKLKTKEGEVYILRSQLKQNEDAKQAAALQNIKLIEEIQGKYNDKLNLTEKELESTKSKLLFRDLEYKTLSERCRQLEYSLSKTKLSETEGAKKQFNRLSQVLQSNVSTKEISFENNLKCLRQNDHTGKEEFVKFLYLTPVHHEGKNLAKILCPEFFKCADEPSAVAFYFNCGEAENHQNKVDKAEKYKWGNLPKQTIHVKDLYRDVSALFTLENFTKMEEKQIIQSIFLTCEQILHHQNEMFKFLDKLKLHNVEYEKADRCLLEKEEKTEVITIKNLLNVEKLNEEECGVEVRRCLALIYSLMNVSSTAFDIFKTNLKLMTLCKDIAGAIGRLRRPLRYTGVLVGICFILQELLEDKHLGKEILTLISDIIKEIIFSRPNLNVLREVINVLAAGKHHTSLLGALCRMQESVDSCMLYMDCKLKQAMFFTKNACPLKLLCMQIMGLACLPCNQNIRWDITERIITWLNSSLGSENSKNLKWLPACGILMEEEKCFNVVECLMYLLVLCLNDYNLFFSLQDGFDDDTITRKIDEEKKKSSWISIIARGAVLFKRILKIDQRQLHEGSYSLRFSIMLKTLMANKQANQNLSSVESDALCWINDLLESDLRIQDCSLKQNTSAIADIDVFDTLKIKDENRII